MVLHVYEWGDAAAPPVVCLHGVLAHGRRFRRLAEERLAASFRIVALDLRGHGFSTWEPPWSLAQHLDDVVRTLFSLGIDAADFIGHSFGGRLTLELTSRGFVRRAVLLDPVVWAPPPIALERAEAERVERAFASPEEALEARAPTAVLAPREFLEEEVRDHLVQGDDGRWRWRYLQSAVVTSYGEIAQPPPPWEQLRRPTLLVAGAHSNVVPEALVDMLRHELGEALEVALVPGGHIPLWDAYAETADAVERFLAG